MTRTKKVPVVPASDEVYELETTTRDLLREKFGKDTEYTYIYLKRFDLRNPSAKPKLIRTFEDLPEDIEGVVLNDHGGGKYLLWINFVDENTQTGYNTFKHIFEIEGPPKIWTPDKPAGAASSGSTRKDMLEEMKIYKDVLGNNNNGHSADTLLILQLMKDSNAMMLELIKNMNKTPVNNSADPLDTAIKLVTLMKSNGGAGELENILSIADRLNERTGGEKSEWAEIAKTFAPAIIPALSRGVPPGGAGVTGTPVVPGAVNANPLIQHIQKMENEMNRLKNELHQVRMREYYKSIPEEDLDAFEQSVNTDGHEATLARYTASGRIANIDDYNNWCNECGIEQYIPPPAQNTDGENKTMGFTAELVRNADPETKKNLLRQYIKQSGYDATYQWCYDNGLINTSSPQAALDDFNKWCNDAGLAAYSPQQG